MHQVSVKMKVDLTSEQAEQLASLFETVRNADKLSLTGMLVAQVMQDPRTRHAYMHVGFVKNHQARQLVQAATERSSVGKDCHRE